jgi:phospholipid transport system substrate-binding protein
VDGCLPGLYRAQAAFDQERETMVRNGMMLGLAVVAVGAPAAAQAPDPARAPVQALSDGLISIMKGGAKMGFAGRARAIAPVVDRAFDLPLMARLSVGPAWTAATPADRDALIAAFRKLTVNQYANNFDSWSGQAFIIDPKVEVRGTDHLVRTTLTQPHGEAVKIAYRLRQSGSEWKIIDVFYQNSISQLATRRDDFQAIVGKGGVHALVGHVNQLADKAAS